MPCGQKHSVSIRVRLVKYNRPLRACLEGVFGSKKNILRGSGNKEWEGLAVLEVVSYGGYLAGSVKEDCQDHTAVSGNF